MARPLSTEARLRIELRELRRQLDGYHAAATVIPREYLEALSALAHIAVNGLRRPDDLGGHITGIHASSTGCREPHPAGADLAKEVARLAAAAVRLDAALERYDPAAPGEGDGTAQSIGSAA